MRKRVGLVFAAVSLLVFMQAAPASANWYAGNRRTAGYGVRADIRTPASQPIMYSGSISSWVSTEDYAGKWAQTGWYFHVDDYAPMDYISTSTAQACITLMTSPFTRSTSGARLRCEMPPPPGGISTLSGPSEAPPT